MRYPNALLGIGVVAAWLVCGRWRKALALALVVAIGFGAVSLVNQASSGAAVPYKAVRASFSPDTGYPVGDGAEEALAHFDSHRATHSLSLKPALEPVVSLYAGLYFVIGRHSGLLFYFPAALVLLATALWRPNRRTLAMLGACILLIVFYLVWMPRNYFGGEGFVGNRYFLTGYAALLVALPRLPRRRWLAVAWSLALVAFVSAWISVERTREIDKTSQSHAHAGVFRLLPYESVARAIDGRRDRYWSDEFLRFVDPYSEVGPWAVRLASGRPAAEVQVANQRKWGAMRLVVHADAPEVVLEYDDWRSHQEFPLVARKAGGKATGVVEILPSRSWRQHPFWWDPADTFKVRNFRLGIRTPDGSPAHAEVRYLGPYHRPHRIFASQVLELELPREAVAGTQSEIPVRIRNSSRRSWSSERVLPVYLTYLIVPHDGGWNPREGVRTRILEPVEPGEVLVGSMRFEWPDQPGNYDLIVDLLVEGVFWFKERAGAPLAEGVVRVVPPSSEGPRSAD